MNPWANPGKVPCLSLAISQLKTNIVWIVLDTSNPVAGWGDASNTLIVILCLSIKVEDLVFRSELGNKHDVPTNDEGWELLALTD